MEEDNYYFDEFIVMLAYSNDLFKEIHVTRTNKFKKSCI